MVKALFDTNILVDYLNGIDKAKIELARYEERAISAITWMEILVGATPATEAGTRAFLQTFQLLSIDEKISDRAVLLRRVHRIKLPDAIVWASAQVNGMMLVTRNTRDFPSVAPDVRVPYRL
jgi:predicted nucleic acid-binding protein